MSYTGQVFENDLTEPLVIWHYNGDNVVMVETVTRLDDGTIHRRYDRPNGEDQAGAPPR